MDVFLIVGPSGMHVLKTCDHRVFWPCSPEVALKSHCSWTSPSSLSHKDDTLLKCSVGPFGWPGTLRVQFRNPP